MSLVVLFSPLLGALISGFFHRLITEKWATIISTVLVGISAFFSWVIFLDFENTTIKKIEIAKWISSGEFYASWAIRLDSLTAVMLVVVCTVSFLVHLYSFGYMSGDHNWRKHENYMARFFSYLSLFTFAMLILVTSDNLLQLFFGWEGVGLASYLLIGFYYKKPSANAAAMKAFIVNRVGDFGLSIGIFVIFLLLGSIQFDDLFGSVSYLRNISISFLIWKVNSLEMISILLFVGAMGKSAQIILHTWLPDAMEGPTPVSALIHAATMVTAGVFLICRMSPVIEYAPVSGVIVAAIGAITALFAATVGLVQNDIKRVIAYSTCSQLGYMFAAAGTGFYYAAMFHLFTHAFFKALLFLGAGSVIHATNHEQDMRHFGGLSKKLPFTAGAMIVGTLAITGVGVPFSYSFFHIPLGFSGFISKDAIIEGAYASNSQASLFCFWFLVTAALMTSFYSWRLIFMTFFGDFKGDKSQLREVHEPGLTIKIPLIVLSIGAIFSGLLFYNIFVGEGADAFFDNALFVSENNHVLHEYHYVPFWVKLAPFAAMVLGFVIAYIFYIVDPSLPNRLALQHNGLYQFLLNKWYFDELYNWLFVRTALNLGNFFWKIGDQFLIDGFINKVALDIFPRLNRIYAKIQSGFLFHYAFAMIIGLTVLVTWMMLSQVGG